LIGCLTTIIAINPTWFDHISETYRGDNQIKKIVVEKILNKENWPGYLWIYGILRCKNRIVIGSTRELGEKLVVLAHDLQIKRHARVQNSYRRLKIVFC